jgi:DNA mismatch endonuclease (patch repair protein)
MDIFSKKRRSEIMSKIRSKNTRPEKILRSLLHKKGLRFRIHEKNLPGKPDIVFSKKKIVIFVHGCFWHCHKGCREGRIPSSNSLFWKNKFEKTIKRDKSNVVLLVKEGWKVLIIWECEIEIEAERSVNYILSNISR